MKQKTYGTKRKNRQIHSYTVGYFNIPLPMTDKSQAENQ